MRAPLEFPSRLNGQDTTFAAAAGKRSPLQLALHLVEGALDYAPGVVADDTVLTRGGRYIDADAARFVRAGIGQAFPPEVIGGEPV